MYGLSCPAEPEDAILTISILPEVWYVYPADTLPTEYNFVALNQVIESGPEFTGLTSIPYVFLVIPANVSVALVYEVG